MIYSSPWMPTLILFAAILTLLFGIGLCILAMAIKDEIEWRWEQRRKAKYQVTINQAHARMKSDYK